jgi:uncharacterized protein
MGRNCISRHVQAAPAVKGFRPFGRLGGQRRTVVLSLDEYEAIRLLDYEHLTQEEAAVRMQISRPTLTRIYEKARVKYATALVEGSILLIEGGDILLKKHIFLCNDCGFISETAEETLGQCPECKSANIVSLDECYQQQCNECRKCHRGGRHGRGRQGKSENHINKSMPEKTNNN